jgi:hypothetical protein
VAFTAHFYGGTPMQWLEEQPHITFYWHQQAVELHNKMNSQPE